MVLGRGLGGLGLATLRKSSVADLEQHRAKTDGHAKRFIWYNESTIMIFATKLHTARKQLELSTETVAQACGISRSYVTLLENGKRLPSVKILPKLAEALGLKTNVVLNWYLEDMRERLQKTLDI